MSESGRRRLVLHKLGGWKLSQTCLVTMVPANCSAAPGVFMPSLSLHHIISSACFRGGGKTPVLDPTQREGRRRDLSEPP